MASIDSRYLGKFRVRISLPNCPRITKTFATRKDAEEWATFQENLIVQIQAAIEKTLRLADDAKQPPVPRSSNEFKMPCLADLAYETPTLHEAA